MSAPQIIMASWMALIVFCAAFMNGKARPSGAYNGVSRTLVVAAEFAILWWGGFWS